jgi:hypothetical protein
LDLKPLGVLFRSKKPAFFQGRSVPNIIIPNRDNLRLNYPLKYPDWPFAVVIYTVLENWESKSYRKEG